MVKEKNTEVAVLVVLRILVISVCLTLGVIIPGFVYYATMPYRASQEAEAMRILGPVSNSLIFPNKLSDSDKKVKEVERGDFDN